MGILTSLFAKTADTSGNTYQSTNIEEEDFEPKSFQIARPRIKSIHGYREDLGVVCRSKMEANVYRFYKYLQLKFGKIQVYYEPELFTFPRSAYKKFNISGYVPDLKIASKNGTRYIEVKGSPSQKDFEKARLMAHFYPRVKIYYIFPTQYQNIRKEYSKMIANWE